MTCCTTTMPQITRTTSLYRLRKRDGNISLAQMATSRLHVRIAGGIQPMAISVCNGVSIPDAANSWRKYAPDATTPTSATALSRTKTPLVQSRVRGVPCDIVLRSEAANCFGAQHRWRRRASSSVSNRSTYVNLQAAFDCQSRPPSHASDSPRLPQANKLPA
jgi:hypothetical protein